MGEFKRHFKAFKDKTELFGKQMEAIQADYKQAYAKFAEGIVGSAELMTRGASVRSKLD